MPSIIVREPDGKVTVLASKPFAYEDILQRSLAELPELIPLESVSDEPISHLTIGTEWPAGTGSADVVLVGSDAVLTIVETKLSRNPEARRTVIAQLLEYAAYLSEWTIHDIRRRADEFFQSDANALDYESFEEALKAFLEDSDTGLDEFQGEVEQNLRQGSMRLIVAVDELGEQALKIVTFLNSYSSFDIFLLQIAAYEESDGREVFVPTLHGYARKTSRSRVRKAWDWDKYQTEHGWSRDEVSRLQELLGRLESVAPGETQTYLYENWMTVSCLGRKAFGAQNSKRNGIELWFTLEKNPEEAMPDGVDIRQTKATLYLSGRVDNVDDAQLKRLIEAALSQAGVDLPT